MKIIKKIEPGALDQRPLYLALGFFDGMHLGHKKVIQSAVATARNSYGQSCVLTFATHPLSVIAPNRAPVLLTPGRQRLDLIADLGVDSCILLPFNLSLSQLEPAQFAAMLAQKLPQLREAFVGVNWRFGRGATGDSRQFKALGHKNGFSVTRVQPVLQNRTPISSTRIREAIRLAKMDDATNMLGRPFSIIGKVTRGNQLGRTLGFPTANIQPPADFPLPHGVYAAYARVDGRLHQAVVNLGIKPTLKKQGPNAVQLEAHVLDFDERLYGKIIEIYFVRRIRREKQFESIERLAQQIERDVRRTRSELASSENRTLQSFKPRIIVRGNKKMRKEK